MVVVMGMFNLNDMKFNNSSLDILLNTAKNKQKTNSIPNHNKSEFSSDEVRKLLLINEDDLVHLEYISDYSAGWALTADGIFMSGKMQQYQNNFVPYHDIVCIEFSKNTQLRITYRKDNTNIAFTLDANKLNLPIATAEKLYFISMFLEQVSKDASINNSSDEINSQNIDEEFEMLKALYENIFGTIKYGNDTFQLDRWMFVNDAHVILSSEELFINSKSDNIELQKKISLKIVCNNKYRDNEIIHAHMNSNCSHGWMLTKDSFCIGGGDLEKANIKYKDIEEVEFDSYSGCIDIETTNENYNLDWCGHPIARAFGDKICEFLKGAATITSNS